MALLGQAVQTGLFQKADELDRESYERLRPSSRTIGRRLVPEGLFRVTDDQT